MKKGTQLQLLLIVSLLVAAPPVTALSLQSPRNVRHDRILSSTGEINRNFLFYDYDASGIAINQDTLVDAGRATLITPLHFVTASHTAATHPGWLTFMDNEGGQHLYRVSHYEQVPGSKDLTVGTLLEPVPEEDGIAHYPVARISGPDYDGAMIGLFGMRQLAGINRLENAARADTEWFFHDFDTAESGVWGRGGDEAAPAMGDSGHPMVAAYAGRLFVLGTHYTTVSSQGVPAFIEEISEIVEGDGYSLEVWETLPRVIADFNPSSLGIAWQDSGILGGTVPTTSPGEPVGRMQSAIGFHHLYAPSDGERPLLMQDAEGIPELRFEGSGQLFATDTDQGTAQGFLFELSTEQPRVYVVARLDHRESGTSTLLELRYSTGPSTLALEYDHAAKRLRVAGMGALAEVPVLEDDWFLAELIREQQVVALSVNGADPVEVYADPAYNGNTDFQSLSVGNGSAGNTGLQGSIGRIVFTDTGEDSNPDLRCSLMAAFQTTEQPGSPGTIEMDPAGGLILHFGLATSENPEGPFERYPLMESCVSIEGGNLLLPFIQASATQRFLRINGGTPVEIPVADFDLVLHLQGAPSPDGPWTGIPIQPGTADVYNHRLRLKAPHEEMENGWFRLTAAP